MVYASAVHLDVLQSRSPTVANPIRLKHKLQTIRLLNETLNDPDKYIIDEVIHTVMALATNEMETIETCNDLAPKSPFVQPLHDAQWLNIYGKMAHVPEHCKAVRYLVGLRGGLENIKLELLAETLA